MDQWDPKELQGRRALRARQARRDWLEPMARLDRRVRKVPSEPRELWDRRVIREQQDPQGLQASMDPMAWTA